MQCYFRDRDNFTSSKTPGLKDYVKFKGTLANFRSLYDLDQYNLKEIDKFMRQLGNGVFAIRSVERKGMRTIKVRIIKCLIQD